MGYPKTLPKVLYKCLIKKHLEQFFSTGEMRIGTLLDFQDNEKHGGQIVDEEEGLKTVSEVINWKGDSQNLPDLPKQFINASGCPDMTIQDTQFTNSIESPNYYVYSVSKEFSVAAMKKMDSKYDSCFVINNPEQFFHAVVQCMGNLISGYRDSEVNYMERHTSPDESNEVPPALIKPPKYAYQTEYRMLMKPTSHDVKPLNIKCKEAIEFCSEHHVCKQI